jgi:predicted nucleic acid-binding protein
MPVIVLDTNVVSELMRPQPDQRVLAWANSLDPESAAITAMSEAEILHGLARLPDGRRKQALRQSWGALAAELFAGRVWAFTSEAAHWYSELVSHRERLARPIEVGAFYWTVLAPDIVNSGREEQGSVSL